MEKILHQLFNPQSISCIVAKILALISANIQGAPIKNNHLGKIHYLGYCNKLTAFTEEDSGHTQQTLLQYLLWFKIYNHLKLEVQFSK